MNQTGTCLLVVLYFKGEEDMNPQKKKHHSCHQRI